jgi:hypothetical protein
VKRAIDPARVARPAQERWSRSEEDVLRHALGMSGLRGAYTALPHRRPAAVYTKAVREGWHIPPLIEESDSRPWTPDEDAILVDSYATQGPKALSQDLRLDRTRLAIKKRAAAIGLAESKPRAIPMGTPWTRVETSVVMAALPAVKAGTPIDWDRLLLALPGRSRASVSNKLNAVRKRPPARAARRRWTATEDEYVRARYQSDGAAAVAGALGRSTAAITNRAYDLQVTTLKATTGYRAAREVERDDYDYDYDDEDDDDDEGEDEGEDDR